MRYFLFPLANISNFGDIEDDVPEQVFEGVKYINVPKKITAKLTLFNILVGTSSAKS